MCHSFEASAQKLLIDVTGGLSVKVVADPLQIHVLGPSVCPGCNQPPPTFPFQLCSALQTASLPFLLPTAVGARLGIERRGGILFLLEAGGLSAIARGCAGPLWPLVILVITSRKPLPSSSIRVSTSFLIQSYSQILHYQNFESAIHEYSRPSFLTKPKHQLQTLYHCGFSACYDMNILRLCQNNQLILVIIDN